MRDDLPSGRSKEPTCMESLQLPWFCQEICAGCCPSLRRVEGVQVWRGTRGNGRDFDHGPSSRCRDSEESNHTALSAWSNSAANVSYRLNNVRPPEAGGCRDHLMVKIHVGRFGQPLSFSSRLWSSSITSPRPLGQRLNWYNFEDVGKSAPRE